MICHSDFSVMYCLHCSLLKGMFNFISTVHELWTKTVAYGVLVSTDSAHYNMWLKIVGANPNPTILSHKSAT